MSALPEPTQDDIDAALEREIESARLSMVRCDEAGDKEGARQFKDAMYALIADRSDEQKARMAKERGLPA
jgi:hypothetical protein